MFRNYWHPKVILTIFVVSDFLVLFFGVDREVMPFCRGKKRKNYMSKEKNPLFFQMWNFLLNYGDLFQPVMLVFSGMNNSQPLIFQPVGLSPGGRTHLEAPHGPTCGRMDRLGLGGGQAGRSRRCWGMSQAGKLGFPMVSGSMGYVLL